MGDDRHYFGVDITSGRRPVTLAELDQKLHVLQLIDTTLEEAFDIISAQDSTICAIDAPSHPNKGLLNQPEFREKVGLAADDANYSSYRFCEYEVRRRQIGIYNTPLKNDEARDWVREGWRLFDQLRKNGYVDFPQAGPKVIFETHPHAGFTVMVKKRPYRKTSLEGRLQRQLVLYQEGVEIPDPMYILEEWTRHRLYNGNLKVDEVYDHDKLDALMAAYTAFLVDKEPQNISAVGDESEGQIVLPTASLLDAY